MKKYIIGDARSGFLSDINTSMLLDGFPFDVKTAKSFDEVAAFAASDKAAIIVINDNLLDSFDSTMLDGRTVYGYAANPNSMDAMQAAGIVCLGMFKTSDTLLRALSKDQLRSAGGQPATRPVQQPKQAPHPQAPQQPRQQAPRTPQPQRPVRQTAPAPQAPAPKPVQAPAPEQPPQSPPAQQGQPTMQMGGMTFTPEMFAMMQQMMAMTQGVQNVQSGASPAAGASQTVPPQGTDAYSAEEPYDNEAEEPYEETPPPKKRPAGSAMRYRNRERQAEEYDDEIDEDLVSKAAGKAIKTKTISTYAAKGGVGKTSIATELAVCLALTSNGRRRFRVCIVDYNIDFGDVASMLELNENGPNMTYWATEIHEMIENGQDPEDITFTRDQMEKYYLQYMKDTGLYALVAPMMHEDSMLIHTAELQVMLRNIIQNGEFDFVICDTGNNTRDSSVTAIEMSDYILLIATQDVTTANCNSSVLRVLGDAGFDTNKVRLIVNNVMSSRETGISVQEVEETFPYPCVCRIKRTPDIIRANNIGRPLVYKPKHDYTKQIQKIVRFVTSNHIDAENQEKPRRGLFGRKK